MNDFAERIAKLPPKRLALLAMELRARLETLERTQAGSPRTAEPIAIIGMGCRFPGNANSLDAYWQLLRDGVDAVTEVPAQRWDIDAYYDPNPDAPGKMASRWGGFVSDIDQFDPAFFGIAPREAMSMDPQQRLLLEVGWEALEHAGYAPDKLGGSSTGVFVGICNSDYFSLQLAEGNDQIDVYLATGSASSVASGRLSYVLGLQGPSLTVDTACSSSLVAMHLAVQSLRNEECRMALAGGANLVLSPNTTVTLSKAKMMASDGRCKTFDASADGFVRAEGCGIVVLKRLSDALAEGDRILAVIRGTAVNQDGRSNGLTAPNGPSQVAVIRQALTNAGVAPGDLSYVETHGTGTSLGDPIEVQALGVVFGAGRTSDDPLVIGSVKTNIGHAEAAAGVAGLIKVVLALQHGEIPPHLHLKQLSPFIPWDEIPVTIPTACAPWPMRNGRRLAGISSFGFSGTNAHIILEAPPQALDTTPHEHAPIDRPLHVLCLSAKNQGALKELALRYERRLASQPDMPFADVAFTANTGRSHFAHRMSVVAADTAQARQALAAYGAGQAHDAILHAQTPGGHPQLAFLFTGQGAQYAGMAWQLYESQPVFRAVIDRCHELLHPYLDQPLLSAIYPAPGQNTRLDETAYTQPALFAIEYALAELWRSWGVTPTVVAGHSVGEYAAACVAGVFSLEDGLKLVAARGRLMQSLPANGEMAAVFTSEVHVAQAIAATGQRISIAAINGPGNVVISGERAAVQSVIDRLQTEGIKARRLAVSIASHSPLMEPILDEFERVARTVSYSPPQIEFVSGVSGKLADGAEVACARYWRRHMREAVRFADVVETLHGQGSRLFVEVGPTPTLIGMARRCLPDEGRASTWLPSLRPGHSDWQQMLTSLGTLYVHGVDPDWAMFDRGWMRRRVVLPTYPFQRARYWFTDGTARARRPDERPTHHTSRHDAGRHPLLGERLQSPALQSVVFETQLSTDWPPYLSHHRIHGMALLPSPAYVEMVLAGATEAFGSPPHGLTNFAIHEALLLPDASEPLRAVQLVLNAREDDTAAFQIFSRADAAAEWTLHATGTVQVQVQAQGEGAGAAQEATQPPTAFSVETLQARCTEQLSGDAYYDRLRALGLEFGSYFRGITDVWRRDGEALGRVQLHEGLSAEADRYHIHPAFLDACFHLLGATLPDDGTDSAYLLIGIDSFRLHNRPGQWLWNHTVLQSSGEANHELFSGDIRLYDASGVLVAEALGLHLKRASRETLLRAVRKQRFDDWLYEVRWQPKDLPPVAAGEIASVADWLPAPERIAEQAQSDGGTRAALSELELYETLLSELDRLATRYIVRALQQLGWHPHLGECVTSARLAAQLGIAERYQRLLGRLLEILGEEGLLRRVTDDWEVRIDRIPDANDIPAQLATLLARYPAAEAEITLTGQCGESLAGALRGEIDPLQLLFPGGSLALTKKLYTESPFARVYNRLIQRALSAAVAALPAGRTVRILEIGAGTGGTTSYLLDALPVGQAEYVFTDVSPLFLTRAEEKYRAFPFVRYHLLDIARDPGAQGFAPHQFDIILASNVLHATEDLRQTLQHVQQLLSPRGLFFLLEGIRRQRWVDITFGLTEGWWAFSDTALRPSYPLLSRDQWLGLLEDAGFGDPVSEPFIPSHDSAEATPDTAGQALFLARGPQAVETEPSKPQQGRWIIFTDQAGSQGGVGEHLARMIQARGGSCVRIRPGTVFQMEGAGRWRIDPTCAEHYHQALQEALEADTHAPLGVVFLWGLDSTPVEATTLDSLQADVPLHCASVLHLIQTLLQAHTAHQQRAITPMNLWLVTRNAQPAGENRAAAPETEQATLSISQAPLWGLGRVIALEHPEWWGGLIDLAPDQSPSEAASRVLAEMTSADEEDQVAYRNGRRYVPRIVMKVKEQTAQFDSWHAAPNAAYLITGGLGGLGLKVAHWLAERGARHLVLLGRTELPPRETWSTFPHNSDTHRRVTAIQAIEGLGAHVTLVIADVGDKVRMTSLFERFGDTLPPLRGIVHAAFAPDAHPLVQMPVEALRDMLHPKVTGAWVLHELTRQMDLDFFVSFSSTTSLWGSRDMAHYAAANQFLDALAHYRRANGLAALTINWGIWDEMRVASSEERHRVMQFGLRPMSSDQALEALGELLSHNDTAQITVAAVDWSTLKAVYESKRARPFLAEVQARRTTRDAHAPESGKPATASSSLSEHVRNLPPEERHEVVVGHIRAEVCKVLGIDPAHTVDEKQGLFEMGMDSLMSIELKSRLEASVGRALPSTLTFNYPTIEDLGRYIETQVLAEPAGATVRLSATPKPLQQDDQAADDERLSDDLSEEELAALLAKKLEQIQ